MSIDLPRVILPLLQQVMVASPCNERWDAMKGTEQVRFCAGCEQNVYDLSAMTTAEAEALLASRRERTCVRFYRRADGTVLTSDCPDAARRRRQRRLAVGVGGFLAASVSAGVGARMLLGSDPIHAARLAPSEPMMGLLVAEPLPALPPPPPDERVEMGKMAPVEPPEMGPRMPPEMGQRAR